MLELFDTETGGILTASPHSFSKRFAVRSSTTGNIAQHAWLVTVCTPSGHRERLVRRAVKLISPTPFYSLDAERTVDREQVQCQHKGGDCSFDGHLCVVLVGAELKN